MKRLTKESSYNLNTSWYPIWLFSLSLLLIFLIKPFIRQGMFLDGIIYAAIAKNLSLGFGTLWKPFYSQTQFSVFYEHPPLTIYIQSLFFKVFGQGFGVERFYSFLMALGQFSLISWYWVKKKNTFVSSIGLLLFLWLLIPLNHLYASNMLESTLTLFSTLASLMLLIKVKSKSWFFVQYLASSFVILIAFLCNGPTALFPLMVPFIDEMIVGDSSFFEGIKKTIFLIFIVTLVFFGFYFLVPEALLNTRNYLEQQLLASVIGTRQPIYVGLKHLNVLLLYVRAYWLVTIFSLACLIISAKIYGQGVLANLKRALKEKQFVLFLLLSLVSSLPVGVSHKQAFNYIMQSAPFYTLAMMYLCFEPFKVITRYCCIRAKLFKTILNFSYLIFVISLISVLSVANGYNRSEAMLKDIKYLTKYCGNSAVLSTSPAIYFNWYTGAYFARNSMISITPEVGKHYYLALKNESIPKNYQLINAPLSYYNLATKEQGE